MVLHHGLALLGDDIIITTVLPLSSDMLGHFYQYEYWIFHRV
jgi:hypothetical protein